MEKRNSKKPTAPTLEAVGVSHKQSHRWQSLAALDEPVFEHYIESAKESGHRLQIAFAVAPLPRSEPLGRGLIP